jgi:excisionase family DNA binding protein
MEQSHIADEIQGFKDQLNTIIEYQKTIIILLSQKSGTSNYSEWLSISQACMYTGLSRKTIYKLRLRGELQFSQFSRTVRFQRSVIDKYLMEKNINYKPE